MQTAMIVRRIGLDVVYGLAYSVRAHRSDFRETESQIVEIVVQLAVDVKSRAESDRIVETESEDFALQAFLVVGVNPPVDFPPEWDLADELKISETYPGSAVCVHITGQRLDYGII